MTKVHSSPVTSSDHRKARLAAALRDNLARRKARSRADKSGEDSEIALVGEVADSEESVEPKLEAGNK